MFFSASSSSPRRFLFVVVFVLRCKCFSFFFSFSLSICCVDISFYSIFIAGIIFRFALTFDFSIGIGIVKRYRVFVIYVLSDFVRLSMRCALAPVFLQFVYLWLFSFSLSHRNPMSSRWMAFIRAHWLHFSQLHFGVAIQRSFKMNIYFFSLFLPRVFFAAHSLKQLIRICVTYFVFVSERDRWLGIVGCLWPIDFIWNLNCGLKKVDNAWTCVLLTEDSAKIV